MMGRREQRIFGLLPRCFSGYCLRLACEFGEVCGGERQEKYVRTQQMV